MTEISQLLSTIKYQLKQQAKTYRDVADALQLSEASIKRMFSASSEAPITLDRIVQISHFLGFSLAELTQEASLSNAKLSTLSAAQEKELVSNDELLLVAVCAVNHWSMADILSYYQLSETACLTHLLKLDHLRLITLLPGNRIRLNISRDFDWLPNGPIRSYFRKEGMEDFLNAHFHQELENFTFTHGMLTETAANKLQTELRLLKRKFAELHAESLSAPLRKRYGIGMLMAMRPWEPISFSKWRK
ncbi:helix-turn-helix domain-containing protein [Undibacterium fentianense]|uniref:Helix-turn-helix transcriptional regulator n=1 Tax=Undibacterium fentianense TaxID=2828728 RepID=A0A941IG98_9BURK|nr:helix-turn-helix domain-containing protein [Undibacterium fentianense]MBR7801586.1 helix-turn-helix transcriptional regulator [Undibacterium fentianense]